MAFCDDYRCISHVDVIKKAFSCSRLKLTQSPQMMSVQGRKNFRTLDSKWNVVLKPLSLRLRKLCERGGREILRATYGGCL